MIWKLTAEIWQIPYSGKTNPVSSGKKIDPNATRYYSFEDLREAVESPKEKSRENVLRRLTDIADVIARHGYVGETAEGKVAFAIPEDMTPQKFVSEMMTIFKSNNIRPEKMVNIQLGLASVIVHFSSKADPMKLLDVLDEEVKVNQLIALPINLNYWDFSTYEQLLKLNAELAAELIIEQFDIETGGTNRLEDNLREAVASFHYA